MLNSEKMYFHNSYWPETLGEEHFLQYSRIVKIRPDLKLENEGLFFDRVEMKSDTVYVENKGGWIFRDWGFGIGDQIIAGRGEVALRVMNCHGDSKLSTRAVSYINNGRRNYSGHRNCGFSAWTNGYNCEASPVRPIELCNITKFTLEQILSIERSI
jgi:hypothetical protein